MKFFTVIILSGLFLFFSTPSWADEKWDKFWEQASTPPNAVPDGTLCRGSYGQNFSETNSVINGRVASPSFRVREIRTQQKVECDHRWNKGEKKQVSLPAPAVVSPSATVQQSVQSTSAVPSALEEFEEGSVQFGDE